MLPKFNGNPLQYSCLENPRDGEAWWAAVHGVAESWTWLSDFTFTFHFHALEKEMAIHSSVLAWRIPGTGEPGGLPSMGLHRVGHNWSDLAQHSTKVYACINMVPCQVIQEGSAEEAGAELHITGWVGCEQYKGPSGKHASKSISISWMWWLIQLARAKGPFVKKDKNRKINCFYIGKSL